MSALAPTLQAFFTDRLIRQRQASPQTIAAYRDTLRLLLTFAASRTGREPSKLDITELDAPFVAGFLDHQRDRARQQRSNPQCAPRGDPLAVPVCRPAPSRTR